MQAIIEKVKKLLAMTTERGASEAEANLAMARAHALLVEHNLSMSELEEKPTTIKDAIKIGNAHHDALLYTAIGKLCFCSVFRARGGVLLIVGKEADIAATKVLAGFATQTRERLIQSQPSDRASRFDYRRGFSHRICDRVDEMIRNAAAASNDERGLVVSLYAQRQADNRAALGNVRTQAVAVRSRGTTAFHAGQSDADKVNLQRGSAIGNESRVRIG